METKIGEPLSAVTRELLADDEAYTAGGFGPLPGYIVSGKGSTMWVSLQPRTINTSSLLIHSNIAVHSATWPPLAKKLCQTLGYDKVAAMASGAEAADSAVKIARKWGIVRKGIKPADVLVLGCSDNYHGLTSGIWPIMNPGCGQEGYGIESKQITNRNPKTGALLRYGHVEDYEAILSEMHKVVAAIIMEPIHGVLRTAEEEINFGIGVRQLCKRYNILFISDEVRMGSGKTGRFLCSDWLGPENKPHMITLGKSISGGVCPASYILGFNDTMSLVEPNQVASTFAMSPMGNAATLAALSAYEDGKLFKRARVVEQRWVEATSKWNHPFLAYCPARGADLGITFKEDSGNVTTRRFARLAYQKGVLVYPQGSRIRISVALTITDEELEKGIRILTETMDEIASYGEIPGSSHRVESINAGF
ncbi:pyridoxal phosphate-dependent transferase [Macrophomina phaseolina]|uniref:Ornithine aminotransferase n=1 Tax=Macrophomina phaseolina TaxID=35725 RepID=A0ABQ8G1X5_9PEZI|nr:pyridoxal phosphate-dependent transferase [Macrophomina phaseolina]